MEMIVEGVLAVAAGHIAARRRAEAALVVAGRRPAPKGKDAKAA